MASRSSGRPGNGAYPWAVGRFAASASASTTCWGGPVSGFPRPRSTIGSPSRAAAAVTRARSAPKYCSGSRSSRFGLGLIGRCLGPRTPRRSPCGLRASRASRDQRSVTVDLDQTLVADPEVVRNLVQHDPPHLPAQRLRVLTKMALERAAIDRDLVREHAAVEAPAPRQRDALVEPEQRLAARRLFLDDDLDVRHLLA